ncbi:MAG TPA: type II toxin-antitoxin system VapC family toxin [Thermoanaerobaculia bacterium]|nr:type II toxin-antitoxin system VapC family toxin [Thermoanaerobaculia bacterium]
MIVIDTSALVDSLTGPKRSAPKLRSLVEVGHRPAIPTLVLYEWLRGPRLPEELEAQEALFPREQALPFGADEAARAAALYQELPRSRGREIDLAIAAHALERGASLWTLNRQDFADVPGLDLVDAEPPTPAPE